MTPAEQPADRDLEGRRARTLAGGMATTVVNRGIYALIPLLAIPVGMEQLGAEGFGAWVTALSTASLITFADLGIGTGLMTRLGAGADSGNVSQEARRQVSSAYAVVAVISGACLVLLLISGVVVDWGAMLNAESPSSGIEHIAIITLSAFVCNMVASLITRVQYGVGQQARSNLWLAAGNVSMLLSILTVSKFSESPSLFIWMAAYAPVLLALINTLHFFRFTEIGKRLSPRFGHISVREMRNLLALGRRFVVISVLMTVTIAADPWIVARTSDLASVPDYVIPYRIFALFGSISVLLALPLWPLHARAVASGDVAWIRRITKRMTMLCGSVAAAGTVLAFVLAPKLLESSLPGAEHVEFHLWLWLGLAAWWLAQTVASPSFMVQNGAEVLWPQTLGYGLSLLAIPIKWGVSESSGYQWIPWIGLAFYVLVIWPCCRVGYRRSLELAARNLEQVRGDERVARLIQDGDSAGVVNVDAAAEAIRSRRIGTRW